MANERKPLSPYWVSLFSLQERRLCTEDTFMPLDHHVQTHMRDREILVLGAGTGGLMTANLLDRTLDTPTTITVIDQQTEHYYQPSFYLLPFDHLAPAAQHEPIDSIVRSDVEFLNTTVEGITPSEQRVHTGSGDLSYSYLVVALGHRLAPETTPGMQAGWEQTDAVYPFYAYEAALGLRERLPSFTTGQLLITVPDTPVKCPGAPLKLAMLADDWFRKRGDRDEIDIAVAGPTAVPFGASGPPARYDDVIQEEFDDRNIEFVPNFTVDQVDYEHNTVTGTDGRELTYDLYAPVPPQYGPKAVVDHSPLTGDGEYITVDPHTLQHDHYERVFALGDNAALPTGKSAAATRKQTHTVVDNLAAMIDDRPLSAEYDGYTACPILTKEGEAMIAEMNYEDAISAPVRSRFNWILDINVIPPTYWDTWLRGFDPAP